MLLFQMLTALGGASLRCGGWTFAVRTLTTMKCLYTASGKASVCCVYICACTSWLQEMFRHEQLRQSSWRKRSWDQIVMLLPATKRHGCICMLRARMASCCITPRPNWRQMCLPSCKSLSSTSGQLLRVSNESQANCGFQFMSLIEASCSGHGQRFKANCGVLQQPDDNVIPGVIHALSPAGASISDPTSHRKVRCASQRA